MSFFEIFGFFHIILYAALGVFFIIKLILAGVNNTKMPETKWDKAPFTARAETVTSYPDISVAK